MRRLPSRLDATIRRSARRWSWFETACGFIPTSVARSVTESSPERSIAWRSLRRVSFARTLYRRTSSAAWSWSSSGRSRSATFPASAAARTVNGTRFILGYYTISCNSVKTLFTELPRMEIPGNPVSGKGHSRKPHSCARIAYSRQRSSSPASFTSTMKTRVCSGSSEGQTINSVSNDIRDEGLCSVLVCRVVFREVLCQKFFLGSQFKRKPEDYDDESDTRARRPNGHCRAQNHE